MASFISGARTLRPLAQSSRLAEFGGLGMSFNICRDTLSLAMFTAIRNASSRVSSFALDRRPELILIIDIGQRLPVVVPHNEARGAFLNRPGRRETRGIIIAIGDRASATEPVPEICTGR